MREGLKQKRQQTLSLAVFLFLTCSFASSLLVRADDAPKVQYVSVPGVPGATPQIVSSAPTTPVIGNSPAPNPNPAAGPAAAPTSSPNASAVNVALGRFRNANGTSKVADMMLERYKESVVRVIVRDHAGNTLSQAMGVAVGKEHTYIATPLSLLLGNAIEWGDHVEIEHSVGNSYGASVALVDEQLDLALLLPDTMPAPIPFVREDDERPGVDVFTIGFAELKVAPGQEPIPGINPKIFKGTLAAATVSNGTLSVSKEVTENSFAGTSIINTHGELVGMLLPNGRGVLSSHIAQDIDKASHSNPFPLRMLGAIMGRGVLVDTKTTDAYKSIGDALAAIKKGEAPKANLKLFIPADAKKRELAPRETGRIILKVMPGIYKEKTTIVLPDRISLTGSGPKETVLMATNPNIPVIKIENVTAVSITGFRLVPAPLQASEAATVLINRVNGAVLLGNLIEAKGGSAVQVQRTKEFGIFGNAFPRGKLRAVLCKESSGQIEGNSLLGDWPQAISIDSGCDLTVTRNLFLETQMGVAVSGQAKNAKITKNTFLRSVAGVRLFGDANKLTIEDNIFSGGVYSLFASNDLNPKIIGRNNAWKNIAMARGKQLRSLDLVRVDPLFENPDEYDFRPKLRNAVAGSGAEATELGRSDLGAYQRTDFLGKYTSYFIGTLEAATGMEKIGSAWGFSK